MIIGGAEDKLRTPHRPQALRLPQRRTGRPDRRHPDRVVPRAARSSRSTTRCSRKLGAADVVAVRPESRERGRTTPRWSKALDDVDRHLHDGRQPAQAVRGRQRHAVRRRDPAPPTSAAWSSRGTSAGASIQSSHMVAFGVGGSTPKQRMTQVAAGSRPGRDVGDRPALRPAQPLRPAADDRGAEPRSCSASASTRTPRAVIVEHATALEILRVVGRGAVTVFDGARMRLQRPRGPALGAAARLRRAAARAARRLGVRPHRPAAGARSTAQVDPDEADELAEAGRDLRQLARDIAAGDATPAAIRRRSLRRRPQPTADDTATEGDRSLSERPHPRPGDPRDPRLPRRQRLVLRQGDPPRRRPRLARGVPDQHAARASPTTCSQMLPGLREHSCSRGRRGGFVERLNEGTWLGHVAEHVALALQQEVGHDIRRGKTRRSRASRAATTSSTATSTSNVGLAAGRLAVRLVNHLVEADPEFDWDAERETFILRAERTAFGPSTQAIVDEAVSRDIPWIRLNQHSLVQLGQGVHAKRIRATMTSETSVDRGRHRLRQGPHHPAARRGRPAGAQAGVGAHRRPGGRASPSGSATRSCVKPLDGNHGRGVCLDLQDEDDVRAAFPIAEDQSRRGIGHRRVATSPARTTAA